MTRLLHPEALARSARRRRSVADIALAREEIERRLADAGHLLRALAILGAEEAPDLEAMAAVAIQAELLIDDAGANMHELSQGLIRA